jgi:hypothetical protein
VGAWGSTALAGQRHRAGGLAIPGVVDLGVYGAGLGVHHRLLF